MNYVGQDLRIALRGFRRTPAFAITVLVILGLGIGTAVAMFTVFRAVLLERLPVRDPERIVVLTTFKDPAVEFGLQMKDLKQIRSASRTLQDVAGYAHWGAAPSPLLDADRAVVLNRVITSERFFDVLGARPLLGRLLRPVDAEPGAALVMVLSYKAWQKTFGGDVNIIGRHLIEPYERVPYTIVGVTPPGLDYPAGADYWIPPWPNSGGQSVIAVARLAPGATLAAAQSELFSIKKNLSPELNLHGARAIAFSQAVLGNIRPVLGLLTTAVGLLLLIACVNVGNLLLLRAGARRQEIAVRRALGASYGDLVRQLLLESGLLAVGGGALGLVWAEAVLRLLVAFAPPQLPRTDVIRVSGTPVVAALGITCVAVLLFGLVPALMAARGNVATTLRFDARSGGDSRFRGRIRHVLVALQTTLALIMLAGGVVLARSLARLERLDLGYDANHLAFFSVSWPALRLGVGPKLFPMGDELTRRWRAIPGVVAVTPTMFQPFLGANIFLGKLNLEGQTPAERDASALIPVEVGGEDYFRTFGIPIRRGRSFVATDREDGPLVAVVSEEVARRTWPGEDPIGKRIQFWGPDSTSWRTVIGVAGNAHLRIFREMTPEIYVPWRQSTSWQNSFALRTSGSLTSVLPAVRREMRAVDPQLALWYAEPMSALLDAPLAQPRMSTLVMSAFGLAALVLAALGLYGLMASIVRERTREIGVRMALGATPERVRRDVLRQALATCGTGALLGIIGSLALSRLLASQLFEVSPTDPMALAGACTILLTVALVAAYLPARRATKIDPARALRSE
jgi:putative ABC transport system permease protein